MVQKPKFHCDVRASFATAFSNWRRKTRIPLKNIATHLGVSISTVSSWESGERFPTGYNFEMLVEYTSLPPCKLFCVMADKCVPADCYLAMSQIQPRRPGKERLAEESGHGNHPPRNRTRGGRAPT